MQKDIKALYDELTEDGLRPELGFEKSLDTANQALLGSTDDEAIHILRQWLGREQPCLFGRIAAKRDLLSFCLIRESDLERGDRHVKEKIQEARLSWTRDGFAGRKSGFIVVVLSSRLVQSEPNDALCKFAARLASLYLLEEIIRLDEIYMDEIYLEKPRSRSTLKWLAGVNVFTAAADGRWWRDHRIPGGLAFSVNSVGHMVASSKIAGLETKLDDLFRDTGDAFAQQTIDSLPKALEFAMRTIDNAAEAPSGKATLLVPDDGRRRCPVALPSHLMGRSCFEYAGFYHTDYTIPRTYFRPDVRRPTDASQKFTLDFTYLFDDSESNPAHDTMGRGRKVRGDSASRKQSLAHGKSVPINGETRLAKSLQSGRGG